MWEKKGRRSKISEWIWDWKKIHHILSYHIISYQKLLRRRWDGFLRDVDGVNEGAQTPVQCLNRTRVHSAWYMFSIKKQMCITTYNIMASQAKPTVNVTPNYMSIPILGTHPGNNTGTWTSAHNLLRCSFYFKPSKKTIDIFPQNTHPPEERRVQIDLGVARVEDVSGRACSWAQPLLSESIGTHVGKPGKGEISMGEENKERKPSSPLSFFLHLESQSCLYFQFLFSLFAIVMDR